MADSKAIVQSQAHVWKLMFAFADSMALRCAVELHIPDILNAHGGSASLSQVAGSIISPSPDINCLRRIMRLLVRNGLFTAATSNSDGGDILYGLTLSSKWLLRDSEVSLAPMVEAQTHQWLMSPWHYFGKCVEEGGVAFAKAHGSEIWEFGSAQPAFNEMFNSAMACTSKIVVEAMLSSYKQGFEQVGSVVVDVGGGTGTLISEIVKAHPNVKGINYDLPHVVASAPERRGVQHVGGDMFVDVPPADAILLKWILHDWSDEDCLIILKNCHKALMGKQGKLIIVEVVLQPEGVDTFDDTRLVFDLIMIAHSSGGKERTESEWKDLLGAGGFPSYKVIKMSSIPSIIEAYIV